MSWKQRSLNVTDGVDQSNRQVTEVALLLLKTYGWRVPEPNLSLTGEASVSRTPVVSDISETPPKCRIGSWPNHLSFRASTAATR
jgi:hypothetical protein